MSTPDASPDTSPPSPPPADATDAPADPFASASPLSTGDPPAAPPPGRTDEGHAPAAPAPSFWALSLLTNHFPSLHGLRFLAILGVVQFHVTAILFEHKLIRDPVVGTLSLTLFFGMDLFFVLSGFLIGTILMVSIERHGRQMVWNFYLRRAFRILPLYYVMLIGLAVAFPMNALQRQHLPYELTYLTTLVPDLQRWTVVMIWGWSLSLEEQFYLLVPLLMWILRVVRGHTARLALLGVLFLSALAVRLWIFRGTAVWAEGPLFQALYPRSHTRYDTLIAGVMLAYIQHTFRPQVVAFFADQRRRRATLAFIGVLLWLLLFPNTWEGLTPLFKVFSWGTITSLMYVPLVLFLLNYRSDFSEFLSSRWFLYVATLGYGIYLVHMPVFDLLVVPVARRMVHARFPLAVVWPTAMILVMVLSIAVSYVLHLAVEKPALWLRDRVAPSPESRRPAA